PPPIDEDAYGAYLYCLHNHRDRDHVAENPIDGAPNGQRHDDGLPLVFDRDVPVSGISTPTETETCGACVRDFHEIRDGDDGDVPGLHHGRAYVFHHDRDHDAHDFVYGHGPAIYRALCGDLGLGRLSLASRASCQSPYQ
ncbi:hypothetical protein F66182_18103, partial [Fusarium sp. NRRL 66182]